MGNIFTVSVSTCTGKICRAWTFCRMPGQDDEEVFENFLAKLEDLKERSALRNHQVWFWHAVILKFLERLELKRID